MKIVLFTLVTGLCFNVHAAAQTLKSSDVPSVVKDALAKKYPAAKKTTWEKEKNNFEANWGGKSGEDMSVQLTPDGTFVEQVVAIPPAQLPEAVTSYVKKNYKGVKITEAGKVTDSKGTHMFEAEVKGKDLIFDEKGNFLKVD